MLKPQYLTYESIHEKDFSVWTSEYSDRPLPRREYSVRKDYNILSGIHRITILNDGWIHEQDNTKVIRSKKGSKTSISKEIGINKYMALKNFDISAGEAYWEKTKRFWKEVRLAWRSVSKEYKSFRVLPKKDGKVMFQQMFEYADKSNEKSDKEIRDFTRKR